MIPLAGFIMAFCLQKEFVSDYIGLVFVDLFGESLAFIPSFCWQPNERR